MNDDTEHQDQEPDENPLNTAFFRLIFAIRDLRDECLPMEHWEGLDFLSDAQDLADRFERLRNDAIGIARDYALLRIDREAKFKRLLKASVITQIRPIAIT